MHSQFAISDLIKIHLNLSSQEKTLEKTRQKCDERKKHHEYKISCVTLVYANFLQTFFRVVLHNWLDSKETANLLQSWISSKELLIFKWTLTQPCHISRNCIASNQVFSFLSNYFNFPSNLFINSFRKVAPAFPRGDRILTFCNFRFWNGIKKLLKMPFAWIRTKLVH